MKDMLKKETEEKEVENLEEERKWSKKIGTKVESRNSKGEEKLLCKHNVNYHNKNIIMKLL